MVEKMWFVALVWCVICLSNVMSQWQSLSDEELSKDYYARQYIWQGPSDRDFTNITSLMADYIRKSPCRALTIRDNCFSHNPERAMQLLKRNYRPSNQSVADSYDDTISPIQWLTLLRDQHILFVGDSTVVALYASLACFFQPYTAVKYKLTWYLVGKEQVWSESTWDQGDKDSICPHHHLCHLIGGKIWYPDYNLSISYQQLNVYHEKKSRTNFVHYIENGNVTVAVINLGAHYDKEKALMGGMWNLREDLVRMRKVLGSSFPSLLWLESFPPHFGDSNAHNMYYSFNETFDVISSIQSKQQLSSSFARSHRLYCSVGNITRNTFYARDWRNRIAEDFIHGTSIIRVAAALFNQWDAHVDYGDSLRMQPYQRDCTHYCLGSGVFRYAISAVLMRLQGCNISRSVQKGRKGHPCGREDFFRAITKPKPVFTPKVARASSDDRNCKHTGRGIRTSRSGLRQVHCIGRGI